MSSYSLHIYVMCSFQFFSILFHQDSVKELLSHMHLSPNQELHVWAHLRSVLIWGLSQSGWASRVNGGVRRDGSISRGLNQGTSPVRCTAAGCVKGGDPEGPPRCKRCCCSTLRSCKRPDAPRTSCRWPTAPSSTRRSSSSKSECARAQFTPV